MYDEFRGGFDPIADRAITANRLKTEGAMRRRTPGIRSIKFSTEWWTDIWFRWPTGELVCGSFFHVAWLSPPAEPDKAENTRRKHPRLLGVVFQHDGTDEPFTFAIVEFVTPDGQLVVGGFKLLIWLRPPRKISDAIHLAPFRAKGPVRVIHPQGWARGRARPAVPPSTPDPGVISA